MSAATLAGGRYRVERVLGRGGMAVVHLARDRELDRLVAIKILADNLAGDAEFRERFVREAQIAARLSHPNVVSVYDAGEEEGQPYIVTEYVPGITLADELQRRGRLDPAPAVDLMLQACGGLEHAHVLGLVHRDVKPGNLLLRLPERTLKVADFGIARAADTQPVTEIGTILGTAAYLAPEQAAGEAVTAAADVYSLGAVLYEALAGVPPYGYGSMAELLRKQDREQIAPLRDLESRVPPGLEDVVMRCLAREPSFRPQSGGELAEALAAASPEPPTEPIRGRLPRTTIQRPVAPEAAPTAVEVRARTSELLPRRPRIALPAAGAAALLALALALLSNADGDAETPPPARPLVEAPAPAADPAEEAQNLSAWLRASSR